ncbi:MAG: fatty acyl-AMP ligase [Gemmatimonadota bacterium]
MTRAFESLIELIEYRAGDRGSARAYTFLDDGEVEGAVHSFDAVATRARAIAASLRESGVQPGDRALLLYTPGLEFISAFFGCLFAGVIAVPAYPPHPAQLARTVPRLVAVSTDSDASIVLTTDALARMAPQLAAVAKAFRGVPWLATDTIGDHEAAAWRRPAVGRDTLAFLQYTSGSTATPKGVMVSHGNLLHNLAYLHHLARNDASSVEVSWLPVIHDMGLIEGVLQPMYAGYPAYLMAPEAFLQRPLRWLRAISRYRGTNSGGPNFAYDLCVRKATPHEIDALDLLSWRCAYNGAEPVRAATLDAFHHTFRRAGFERTSFFPAYGLAESTLLVSTSRRDREPTSLTADAEVLAQGSLRAVRSTEAVRSVELMTCGSPGSDTDVRIVDPETCELCAPGNIGEIWTSSPSVALGYWKRPAQTTATFHAHLATGEGPFLRTGDLGVLHEGEVVVTGRIKDLLVIRGAKHYPQDLELTAERAGVPIRPGCSAAFVVDALEGEGVAMLAEVGARELAVLGDDASEGLSRIASAIRLAVMEQHGIQLEAVVLITQGTLPKTTSGKLQRHACRDAFETGALDELARWTKASVIASPRQSRRELAHAGAP